MPSSRLLLVASLALNLFVLGVLFGAGGMYLSASQTRRDSGPASASAASAGRTLWAVSTRLSPAHRKALQDYLTREGEALAEPIHQLRTQRRHAIDAMGAETYDAAAAARAQSDAQDRALAIRRELTTGLTQLMADFTPEERRLLAEPAQKSRIGRPADAQLPTGPSPDITGPPATP